MESTLNPIMTEKIMVFRLVLWYLPSERHFQALTMKCLLNYITTQTKANLQKYGRTPPNHRFKLLLWFLSSERHFGAVTLRFSLNANTT